MDDRSKDLPGHLDEILNDPELVELRRAYFEHQAFETSEEFLRVRRRMEDRIKETAGNQSVRNCHDRKDG